MLGEKVKKLREDRKMTQHELANAIGISQSSIGMIEGNKRPAGRKTLIKLADFFGVTFDYLLADNEELNISEDATPKKETSLSIKEQEKLDKEAQQIIDELTISFSKNKDNLDDKDYMVLQESIRAMLETMTIKNKEKYTPKKYKKDK